VLFCAGKVKTSLDPFVFTFTTNGADEILSAQKKNALFFSQNKAF